MTLNRLPRVTIFFLKIKYINIFLKKLLVTRGNELDN